MHPYPELPYTELYLLFIYYILFLLNATAYYNNITDLLVIRTQYIYLFNKAGILNYYKPANILCNSFLNIKPNKVLLIEYIYHNYYIGQFDNSR